MAQDVPPRETERVSDSSKVARIVLDARASRARRSLGCSAPSLIVEDQLASFCEGRESGPQQVVIEEKPAVHADKRNGAGFLGGEKHGKVEPACTNGAPSQARRSWARASKSDETFAGCYLRKETAGDKIVMRVTFATVAARLRSSAISDQG